MYVCLRGAADAQLTTREGEGGLACPPWNTKGPRAAAVPACAQRKMKGHMQWAAWALRGKEGGGAPMDQLVGGGGKGGRGGVCGAGAGVTNGSTCGQAALSLLEQSVQKKGACKPSQAATRAHKACTCMSFREGASSVGRACVSPSPSRLPHPSWHVQVPMPPACFDCASMPCAHEAPVAAPPPPPPHAGCFHAKPCRAMLAQTCTHARMHAMPCIAWASAIERGLHTLQGGEQTGGEQASARAPSHRTAPHLVELEPVLQPSVAAPRHADKGSVRRTACMHACMRGCTARCGARRRAVLAAGHHRVTLAWTRRAGAVAPRTGGVR